MDIITIPDIITTLTHTIIAPTTITITTIAILPAEFAGQQSNGQDPAAPKRPVLKAPVSFENRFDGICIGQKANSNLRFQFQSFG